MRIGNSIRVGLAAAATILATTAASAQTWYTAPTPGNAGTGAFWNNASSDNAGGLSKTNPNVCNIGAVLMGIATNPQCNNEVPSGMLPLTVAQQLTGTGTRGAFLGGATANTRTGFLIEAGEYRFDLYGRVAGFANSVPFGPRIGYFTFNSSGQRVMTEFTGAAGSSALFTTTAKWGFWMSNFFPGPSAFGNANIYFSDGTSCQTLAATLPSCAGSAASNQFALFSASLAGAPSVAGGVVDMNPLDRLWIGGEDNAGPSSDADFQDVVGSFTQLPEPASFALFGTGLLGVLAVGSRRKRIK